MQYQHHPRRYAAIFFVSSVGIVSAFAGSDQNLPNFNKVDDHVYRGGQPTDDGFKNLANLGIKTVIDLRDTGEHSQAHEEMIVTGLGMRYLSIPMQGMSRPNDIQVAKTLALLTDGSTGPVFVHCKRGADRTGMLIAVYRIAHDRWTNQTALTEAKSNGMSFFERAIQHYVTNYKPATDKPNTDAILADASPAPQVRGAGQ